MLPLDLVPALVRALLAAGAQATAARLVSASRGCRAAGRRELLRAVCARGWTGERVWGLLPSAGHVRRLEVAVPAGCGAEVELVRACGNLRSLRVCAWDKEGARGLLAALPSLNYLEELEIEGAGWEACGEEAVAFPPSLRRVKVTAVSKAEGFLRALEAAPGLKDLFYVSPDFGSGCLAAFPGLLAKLQRLETDAADLIGLPSGLSLRNMRTVVLRCAEELDAWSWGRLCSALDAERVVLEQTCTSRVLDGLPPRAGTVVLSRPVPGLDRGRFGAAARAAAGVDRLVLMVAEGSPSWSAAQEERGFWRSLFNAAWIGC
ncbi:hypothetical protein DFJ74DRAFT_740251 [Hyaloraphidium curvatum]|nr:hypothetical protein DFJ74DRAFT_740251 [Hyaloraphidium curvatum]